LTSDIHLLSGAYVLDAIDEPQEKIRFETHLAQCQACRTEVRSLQAEVVALGEAVAVDAPRPIWANLLAQIDRIPQRPAQPPPATHPPRRPPFPADATRPPSNPRRHQRQRRRTRPATVTAVALLLLGSLGGAATWLARQPQRSLAAVPVQQEKQTDTTTQRVLSIASSPKATRVSKKTSGGATVTVFVAAGQAAIIANGLDQPASGTLYQCWLIPSGGSAASATPAVMDSTGSGQWMQVVTDVHTEDKIAISVEPEGGSATLTSKPMVTVRL
jgi:anti-sigma-K factor RskA